MNKLEYSTVLSVFPEAKTTTASGHLEYVVHCPRYHKKGGKYKLSINSDGGAFLCHDCGFTGNAFLEFFDSSKQFFKGYDVHVHRNTSSERVQRPWHKEWQNGVPSPGKMVKISSLSEKHPAVKYLAGRGITQECADRFNLLYCKQGDFKFSSGMGTTSGRIIFPVVMSSELAGWQARQIEFVVDGRKFVWKGEKDGWIEIPQITLSSRETKFQDFQVPKYYTCPGMKRSRTLYNFDNAIKDRSFVIVVEGPIDAIKVGRNCVASFGKKLTNDQVRILCSNWSNVIMILDEEVDTEEKWFKDLEDSFSSVHFEWTKLDGFEDPGAASKSDIWEHLHRNVSLFNDNSTKKS